MESMRGLRLYVWSAHLSGVSGGSLTMRNAMKGAHEACLGSIFSLLPAPRKHFGDPMRIKPEDDRINRDLFNPTMSSRRVYTFDAEMLPRKYITGANQKKMFKYRRKVPEYMSVASLPIT
jgi:hypothetical protein